MGGQSVLSAIRGCGYIRCNSSFATIPLCLSSMKHRHQMLHSPASSKASSTGRLSQCMSSVQGTEVIQVFDLCASPGSFRGGGRCIWHRLLCPSWRVATARKRPLCPKPSTRRTHYVSPPIFDLTVQNNIFVYLTLYIQI